jgi:hypothetical protein
MKTIASRIRHLAKNAKLKSDSVQIIVGIDHELGNEALWFAAYRDGDEYVMLKGYHKTMSKAVTALEEKLL